MTTGKDAPASGLVEVLDERALESAWLAHDNACPREHWRKRERMAAGIRAYLAALQAPQEAGVTDEPTAFLIERLAGAGYGSPRSIVDAAKYDPRRDDFWVGDAKTRHLVTPLYAGARPAPPQDAAVEKLVEIAREHLEIDGDGEGPFIRFDSIENAVRAVLAATRPAEAQAAAEVEVSPTSVLSITSAALSESNNVLMAVHEWQAGSEMLPLDLWARVRDVLRKAGRI